MSSVNASMRKHAASIQIVDEEVAVLAAVNRYRASVAVSALANDPLLTAAARAHSRAMAEHRFFSHHSPLPGLRHPSDRIRAAGGAFDATGENIAMYPAGATADDFVDGWIRSPGHRENIVGPDWTRTGVGMHLGQDGRLYATQLFGIPSPVRIEPPTVRVSEETGHSIRFSIACGNGYEVATFVRNGFIGSGVADGSGVAEINVWIPDEEGIAHVGLARRRVGVEDAWIGIHDGIFRTSPTASPSWDPGPTMGADVRILSTRMYRVVRPCIHVTFRGEADVSIVIVVDGVEITRFPAGAFETAVTVPGASGAHIVDVGIPADGNSYRVCRRFDINADQGTIREGECG